jgi:hypothetical protein
MADVEHHKFFPPSSSSRWLSCTASVLPISKLKDSDNSSFPAAEGTFAHDVFADILEARATGTPRVMRLGDSAKVDGYTIELTQDMEDYLQSAVEYVDSLGKTETLLVEEMVGLNLASIDETITGHADVILRLEDTPGTLHVLDLKYGKGVRVNAEGNTQMMLYGAAALDTFGMVFEDISELVVHVVQPRIDHFDPWSIEVQRLADWVANDVSLAVIQALDPEQANFAPSDDACRWCPLAGTCEANFGAAMEAFDILPKNAEIAMTDPVTLSAFLEKAPLMESAIRHARAAAMDRLRTGVEVPGWKLVAGRSKRVWNADEDIVETALKGDGIEPYTQSLKTPPAAEKELGKKLFSAGHAVNLVRYAEGRPTLAPESDKREAYVPDDGTDAFDVLEDEE